MSRRDPAFVLQTAQRPPGPPPLPTPPSRLDRFSALLVLTLFGMTWPVLDLLGRNAEFFLARRSPRGEILGLGVVLTMVIPVLVGMLGLIPGVAGRLVTTLLLTMGSTSLASLYLRRLPWPWWVHLPIALVVGIVFVWGFHHFPSARTTARYLVLTPLLLLGVYLFATPVGAVLGEPDGRLGNPLPIASPAPVVMLVFDEFPLASIIDSSGELRADRYPNFARLASDGIWYPNAVTVQQQTEHSVPAILTGSVPDQSLVPITGQYPFNLFTGLRNDYDLFVYESITQLCPRALCESLTNSVSSLSDDVSVVAGHVLLPEPMTKDLPAIDRAWGDFTALADDFEAREEFREELRRGPRLPIDDFLQDIGSGTGQRPPLYYLHAILPHHPWQYLPDGRRYPYIVAANPAAHTGGWIGDEFLVAQSMQRHLLQVGYVDSVLGEVITALEARGLYEDSLMVVVADHGIAIRPDVDNQRRITEESIGEIAAVPLFVKLPGNDRAGTIDQRRALTIDIMPTVAHVLDARLPSEVEGVSLLGPDPRRTETTTYGPDSRVTYGVDGSEKLSVAARLEELFPGGDPWALRPAGSPDLVGTSPSPSGQSDLSFHLLESGLYDDVELDSDVIPARIGGALAGPVSGNEVLAVAVNGEIATLTRAYIFENRSGFLAMVHPDFFVPGANVVELFEVSSGGKLLTIPRR
ncbi:MAG TPA: sulfatase-like hydrolase/transferase [Acidimicrobiia bacterium]|nr:sulfatase-like hydrolase/transferase [Acidimicrobiia bacterium]